MSDMRRLLESMDKISKPAKKSTGPKFPGYWKGTDDAAQARDKMVGSAQESVIPELAKQAKEKTLEWKIQEAYQQFKEQGYSGVDPIVRQRMGMQPATQDEIQSYLDKNPSGVTTSTGQKVTTGSEAPVVSGGLTDVAKAAVAASPAPTTKPEPANAVTGAPQIPAGWTKRRPPLPPLPAPADVVVGDPITSPTTTASTTLPQATPNTVTSTATPTKPATTKPVPAMPQKVAAGSWQDIWKNNPDIKNSNVIYAGQEIKLPNGTSAIVDKGDTLSSIAQRYRQGGYNTGTEIEPTTAAPAAPKATVSAAPSVASASKVSGAPLKAQQTTASEPAKAQSNPTVELGFGDPGYTPIIGNKLEKRSDGKWYYAGSGNTPVRPDVAKYAETQLARQTPPTATTGPNRTAPVTGRSSFADLVGYAETGDKNIPNQTGSSAAGVYGFMPTAFKGFVDAAKPGDPLYGKTWNDYLTNVDVQRATMAAQEKDINYQLAKNNIEPNVGNKYLMHFLGSPTAVPVMKALEKDPKTPLSTWFGRDPYPDVAIADTPAAFNKFKQSNPGHPISKLDYNQYRNSRPAVYRQNPQLSRENIRTVADISNWSNRKMAQAAGSQKNEAVNKLAEQFAAFMEAQDQYGPEYQAMVKRVGQRAKQGPLKTVWDPVKRVYKNVPVKQDKKVATSEAAPSATTADAQATNPNAQATNPNAQITQRADNEQDNQAMDSVRDVAVAASTVGGLKNVLGPQIDQRTAATAMNKMTTGQAMSPQEQQAISSIVPLMAKAAQEPSTAGALRSALQRAGTLAKQGK